MDIAIAINCIENSKKYRKVCISNRNMLILRLILNLPSERTTSIGNIWPATWAMEWGVYPSADPRYGHAGRRDCGHFGHPALWEIDPVESDQIFSCFRRYQQANRQIALQLLAAKLYQLEEEKKMGVVHSFVKNAGRGERSDKIRTYNFPQNRITDHRINKSWHDLENIISEGKWEKVMLEIWA